MPERPALVRFLVLIIAVISASSFAGSPPVDLARPGLPESSPQNLSIEPPFPAPASAAPVTLGWNTFVGSTREDSGKAVAVDSQGNIYIAGYAQASWGQPGNPFAGGLDIMVAKLSSSGTLAWNTFLGSATGNNYSASGDSAYALAVDASGNIYITGVSNNTWGNPVKRYSGQQDAFVAKLNGSNGSLIWNTFLGGPETDSGYAITTSPSGGIYLSGVSSASWGQPVRSFSGGVNDSFVAQLDAGSGALLWLTFIGGAGADYATNLAADALGNVYVAGGSNTTWGSPVRSFTSSYDNSDAFVAKLSGGAILWNTFLGGTGYDLAYALALDPSGGLITAGKSNSSWGNPINRFSGSTDAFVVKLDPASGVSGWSTFLGGTWEDEAFGLATDKEGNIYVCGESAASWGSPALSYTGAYDAFVAKLSASGPIIWNAFLGSSIGDIALSMAVDTAGRIDVLGESLQTWGNPRNAYAGARDVFVAQLVQPAPARAKMDLIGTWSTGVWTRNSETGAWTLISSSGAEQLIALDIDGDGKDDIVGVWPSGTWARLSSTNAWTLLASPASQMAAGDLNNDGKKDLLGIWGTTVWARDAVTHAWRAVTTGAFCVGAADLDGDGKDDLVGDWSSGLWMLGSKTNLWQLLSTHSDGFKTGDFDGDGKQDLIGYWITQDYLTELWIRYTGSATWFRWIANADDIDDFAAGDLDGDGKDDLIGTWAGNGTYFFSTVENKLVRLASPATALAAGKLR